MEEQMNVDIRKALDESPMTRFQTIAVTMCVLLDLIDGFDVLAMAFTAPRISANWHLSATTIGAMLGAGMAGMAAGAVLIAPLADRLGRRRVILACLTVIASGMLASAISQDALQLIATRFYTGLGIGGLIASIATISSEYASSKWRGAAVGLQSASYSVGVVVGGVVAAHAIPVWGWRSVFALGGLVTLLAIPAVFATLPESLDFLISKRPAKALERINATLARMGWSSLDAMPAVTPSQGRVDRRLHWFAVFKEPLRIKSVLICAAFFLAMGTYYFIVSWTPKLLVQSGMSTGHGITSDVLLSIGGIAGATIFSLMSVKAGLRGLLTAAFLLGACLLIAFGLNTSSWSVEATISVSIGVMLGASIAGIYGIAPTIYPTELRTTGMGFATAAGRLGGFVAPIIVGVLLDRGWSIPSLYFAFFLPMAIAAAAVYLVGAHVNQSARERSLPSFGTQ